MTIKQQGGIFGRNPTFNDVEVTDLTVGNDAFVSGDASVSGELTVTGDAGFGTTNPSKPVHVYSSSSLDHILVDGPVTNRNIGWATNGSARWNFYTTGDAESGSNAGSNLRLATYTDAGAYNGRVMDFYRDTKDVMITSGNLIINTSGKGIDFSATSGTGTSELFDDYEEGTWTPSLTYSTSAPSSITYANQDGYYVKTGNSVFFVGRVKLSAISGGSGALRITGFPFAARAFTGFVQRPIPCRILASGAVNPNGFGILADNNTYFDVVEGDGSYVTTADMTGDEYLTITGTVETL